MHKSSCITVVALVTQVAACGTLSIGRGPSDLDLANDGSAEQQSALQRNYELSLQEGMFRRPGADPTEVSAEIGERVAQVATPAYSENAEEYLATSAPAAEISESGLIAFDRFTHATTTVSMIWAGTVGIAAAAGAASALAGTADGFTPSDATAMVNGALAGGLAGTMLALPVGVLYALTVEPLSSALAAGDYRKATRAFNADLTTRIKAAAKTPLPPAAPPTPAASTPAPLEEPPPPALDPAAVPTPG